MSEIIGIIQTKGGVSKTTTAVHLATWLKDKGYSVVFLNASFQTGVHTWLESLDIPFQQETDIDRLADLAEAETQSDYVIIDVPGVSEIVRPIFDYCNQALIPVQPTALSLKDAIAMINMVNRKQRIRKDLKVDFFLSMIDSRSNSARDAEDYFSSHQIKLLKTRIRRLKIIEDTPLFKSTVFNLSERNAKSASQDYQQLFTEFLPHA